METVLSHMNPYVLQILVNIGIGIILALGLNVITGFTGQLTLGHAAFMSIGAFAGALLTIKTSLPFIPVLFIAASFTAVAGVLIGYPILRLTGDYLAISTLGFAEIVKVIFLNLEITNRALGLTVPPPRTSIPLPFLVWGCTILAVITVTFVKSSRFGRALAAIREDEIAAESMGIDLARYKYGASPSGPFSQVSPVPCTPISSVTSTRPISGFSSRSTS